MAESMLNHLSAYQRFAAFALGVVILIAAALDECSRVSQVIIGLLLMGIFSADQIVGLVIRNGKHDNEPGESNDPH